MGDLSEIVANDKRTPFKLFIKYQIAYILSSFIEMLSVLILLLLRCDNGTFVV